MGEETWSLCWSAAYCGRTIHNYRISCESKEDAQLAAGKLTEQAEKFDTRGVTHAFEIFISDDEYTALQVFLIARPNAGKIIRGSGGIRKLRWAIHGKGKSGGARVVYYWTPSKDHVYFLTAYTKGEREDIDRDTVKRIRKLVETLK